MKKIWGLLMAAMISSLVVVSAGTAAAMDKGSPAAVAFVFSCNASLSEWPSASSSGACNNFVNLGGGTHGVSPFAATSVSAFFFYQEPCTLGVPPTSGFAQGIMNFGSGEVNFVWVRVGVVAVIVTAAPRFGHDHMGSGAGVAAFAPLRLPLPNTCSTPGPLQAIIAGPVVAAGI